MLGSSCVEWLIVAIVDNKSWPVMHWKVAIMIKGSNYLFIRSSLLTTARATCRNKAWGSRPARNMTTE